MTLSARPRYERPLAPDFGVEGVEVLRLEGGEVVLSFDARQTSAGAIVEQLSAAGNLIDLVISEPALEEVIREIYQEAGQLQPAEGAPP